MVRAIAIGVGIGVPFAQGGTVLPATTTTNAASSVARTTATLNGTVNPNGVLTNYYFEYGTTTAYGTTTTPASAGSGSSDVPVTANVTGLTAGTTYHFRLVTNDGIVVNGSDATFTTLPAYAFLDTFTGANGTALTAHTEDYPGDGSLGVWINASGAWDIQSGRAHKDFGNADSQTVGRHDTGLADGTLTCDMTCSGSVETGLVIRHNNTNAYWLIDLNATVTAIVEQNAGVYTIKTNVPKVHTAGVTYAVRVVFSGTTISVYEDGVLITTYASATMNQTATFCGIRSYLGDDTTFDNFQVNP